MRVTKVEGKARSRKARSSKTHRFLSRRLCSWKAYVLCLAVLFCTLPFVGCQESSKSSQSQTAPKVDKVVNLPVEKRKAELFKELDQRFENPDAHYELGQLYQADGLWAQAEYRYNVALSFKPSHREAQAALVKVMLDSGNKEKADNYCELFMNQTGGSASESLKLAEAFKKQHLDEQALACYQQALRLAPNSSKINRQIGYYYLSKGEKERARDYLSCSFDLNPNQPDVAGELGRLGVEVKIPRSTVKYTKNLDKIVEPASKEVEK